MSIAKQIKKLNKSPSKEELELAQGRIPKKLKQTVEAKFLSLKSQGEKITWQILIEAACIEFLES